LHAHAETLNSRTLSRRLTALKHWHSYQGFTDPTSHPLVRKTLTGIQNVHGKPKEKAAARWRHQGTVLGYIEAGQRFEENAAKILLSEDEC